MTRSSRSLDWLRGRGLEPIIYNLLVIFYLLNSKTPPSWMISKNPLALGWQIGNSKSNHFIWAYFCDLESWFIFLRMPYFDAYFSYYWIAKKSILSCIGSTKHLYLNTKKIGNILRVLVMMLWTNKILLSYFWRYMSPKHTTRRASQPSACLEEIEGKKKPCLWCWNVMGSK